jgi:predicted acyltransferase
MSPTTAPLQNAAGAGSPQTAAQRLVSLDAFRGLTIALMIVVNNAGSGRDSYSQLRHSEWHGWTATDTVFPSFLWIVGVAITLSLGRRLAQGVPRAKLVAQAFRRAAVIFVLGLAVYAAPNFDLGTQRILGVLQRIAICYLIASLLYLFTGIRSQICCIVALLVVYWALMTLVPVPGYGAGRLDVEGNFAHYVDRLVLGRHNYAATKDWDPEGLVSTLPAIATALFGVLAGWILRLRRSLAERTRWMLLAGAVLLLAGYVANQWMPINKKLWTDSFCLFMAGLDFVVFALFLWLVDIRAWRKPVQPMVVFGMNAIAIYLASEFTAEILDYGHFRSLSLQQYIYRNFFAALASPANASLLYSLAFTGAMYGIAWALYRRRWFLKI